MVDDMGRYKEIKQIHKKVKSAVHSAHKKVKKNKEKKKKKSMFPAGVSNLPTGTFIFSSVKKGFPFYLKLRVVKKGGTLIISVSRTGMPIIEGQWEEASKGKPPAIIKYVKEKILKDTRGKVHVHVRTEGASTQR